MGILSDLDGMGTGGAGLFEESKDNSFTKKKEEVEKTDQAKLDVEKTYVFDKTYECPVCHEKFTDRTVMSGKARLIKQDKDLRPVFSGIDTIKYDVVSCDKCGYSALAKWFPVISPPQAKLVKENITRAFHNFPRHDVVSYDEAIDRYKLALANCIVKKGSNSEKAYTCLKLAWILRGKAENLDREFVDYEDAVAELKKDEKEMLHSALEGFLLARQSETPPIAGMDETTLDYLLAVLLIEEGRLDDASRLVAGILQSRNANQRIKDKARDLKEEIVAKRK